MSRGCALLVVVAQAVNRGRRHRGVVSASRHGSCRPECQGSGDSSRRLGCRGRRKPTHVLRPTQGRARHLPNVNTAGKSTSSHRSHRRHSPHPNPAIHARNGAETGPQLLMTVGDMCDFPTSRLVASYAGLSTRTHQSGTSTMSSTLNRADNKN